MESDKIYSDDKNVPYKNSELSPLQSKMEIEGVLAKYGIKDSAWRYDPIETKEIFVGFSVPELINGEPVNTWVKVYAPLIWKRGKPSGHGHPAVKEEIDWRISMRVMFWYIKSSLEVAFLWRIRRSAAFLPFIRNSQDQPMGDVILSRIQQLQNWNALEDKKPVEKLPPRVINPGDE